jgi:hypothetical protein
MACSAWLVLSYKKQAISSDTQKVRAHRAPTTLGSKKDISDALCSTCFCIERNKLIPDSIKLWVAIQEGTEPLWSPRAKSLPCGACVLATSTDGSWRVHTHLSWEPNFLPGTKRTGRFSDLLKALQRMPFIITPRAIAGNHTAQ